MANLHVYSEIGKLKKVMLHRPGGELENLTPKWLERLLFDDIPWLYEAQKEHDAFAKILRDNGVEVVYLVDLVTEAIDASENLKVEFIKQFIHESHVTNPTIRKKIMDYLLKFPTKEMIRKTMAGVKKLELTARGRKSLSDYIRDYPFVCDPMPNLYFTRDPFSVIGNGVSISSMYMQARSRETIYAEYIFKYHPEYKRDIPIYYNRGKMASLEGGDILVLNKEVIAIGVSERTHPDAIEEIAKELFFTQETSFQKVLAINIPKKRAYMHLDTVMTQVDKNTFTIHHEFDTAVRVYELSKGKNNQVMIRELENKIDKILAKVLGYPIKLIPCGGNDIISANREQWSDGANTLCIEPGKVIVYNRNHITNALLEQEGITTLGFYASELSRGRGGPRCMSMPLERENL